MTRNQAGFLPPAPTLSRVDGETVQAWFGSPEAVVHYSRAAAALGLWRSEVVVCTQVFRREQRLLDVGCGAGRIALGLWQLGYRQVVGIDFCPQMVAEGCRLVDACNAEVRIEQQDATDLRFADGAFDGAIFGFNGLMQIPGRDRRRRVLAGLHRVVRGGGCLVFTTHDRELSTERRIWQEEAIRWQAGRRPANLGEFGDRVLDRPEGMIFMHLPDRDEVLADLAATGWHYEFDELRSCIANEPAEVREFADECRFWIARA